MGADLFPVVADLADRFDIQPGVVVGVAQGFDNRAQGGLRGVAGKRIHRRIDGINPGLGGGQHRRDGSA